MDRESRKMLKFMCSSNLCKSACLFDDFYDEYGKFSGLPDQRIMACMRHLGSLGYIVYNNDQFGHEVGFELEHKAYHHLYFSLAEHWRFVRNSIVVPVAVSFVTTLLASELWPRLRPLLAHVLQSVLAALQ